MKVLRPNATEQYIRQATRGLSGQARRDAQTELRGAIEDKIWRFTLLGLDAGAAQSAALRDLGSPHAVAQGLTRVHTLPKAALGAVLAGVACLLGVQALAAVPVVRAGSNPQLRRCTFDDAYLSSFPEGAPSSLRAKLAEAGGRALLEAKCRNFWAEAPAPANQYLRLSDVVQALKLAQVQVDPETVSQGILSLTFPGQSYSRPLDVSSSKIRIEDEDYVGVVELLQNLRFNTDLPLRLIGQVNPVLEVGPARLQLGTAEYPVDVINIYSEILVGVLGNEILNSQIGNHIGWESNPSAQPSVQRTDTSLEDGLYVSLSNELFIRPTEAVAISGPYYLERTGVMRSGTVPLSDPAVQIAVVDTSDQLSAATSQKKMAVLVYKLDTSDLRNLKLTPVPASQIKVLPAR